MKEKRREHVADEIVAFRWPSLEPIFHPTKTSSRKARNEYGRLLRRLAERQRKAADDKSKRFRQNLELAAGRARRLSDALKREKLTVAYSDEIERLEEHLRALLAERRESDLVAVLIDYLVEVEGMPRTRAYRVLSEHVFRTMTEGALRARHEKAIRARA